MRTKPYKVRYEPGDKAVEISTLQEGINAAIGESLEQIADLERQLREALAPPTWATIVDQFNETKSLLEAKLREVTGKRNRLDTENVSLRTTQSRLVETLEKSKLFTENWTRNTMSDRTSLLGLIESALTAAKEKP